jgi:hypothetical protein
LNYGDNEALRKGLKIMFFYSENPERGSGNFDPSRFDANTCYRKHLENWFFLRFITEKSKDFSEKRQAEKELIICNRKLVYWAKSGSFDTKIADEDIATLKAKWNIKGPLISKR